MKKTLLFTSLILTLISTMLFSSCSDSDITAPESNISDAEQIEQNVVSESNVISFSVTSWTIIDSLPYTITQPGSYKLRRDLESYGVNGITVSNTNHVNINLNGHSIYALPSAVTEQTGIVVTNSSFVIIYEGDINNYRSAFSFVNSSDCSTKNIEYTPLSSAGDVPPHYSGVKISNSPRIQVSWSVFNTLDNAVEITGAASIDDKFLSNTCYGNPNPSTGRTTGVKVSDTLSSPQKSIIRNNLFTGFDYGYNVTTKNGNHKINSNTFEFYIEKGFNNDATNEFKYNTYRLLTP
ncbi:MAG: hypothetical protein JNK43_01830 [Ignavibacteria bacterium]|nr:hypothetical protein [Ignavibacteria bacterium]